MEGGTVGSLAGEAARQLGSRCGHSRHGGEGGREP